MRRSVPADGEPSLCRVPNSTDGAYAGGYGFRARASQHHRQIGSPEASEANEIEYFQLDNLASLLPQLALLSHIRVL